LFLQLLEDTPYQDKNSLVVCEIQNKNKKKIYLGLLISFVVGLLQLLCKWFAMLFASSPCFGNIRAVP
jgi:hypothetical protein